MEKKNIELTIQIIFALISVSAFIIALKALIASKNANKISEKSNKIAEDSNKIAREAKGISKKSFQLEKQEIVKETKFKEKERLEKIMPNFKVKLTPTNLQGSNLNITNTRNTARNFIVEISSDNDHSIQGTSAYKLFKPDITYSIIITGPREKPYTLELSFEDNDKNKYEQVVSFDGRSIDDAKPPQLIEDRQHKVDLSYKFCQKCGHREKNIPGDTYFCDNCKQMTNFKH